MAHRHSRMRPLPRISGPARRQPAKRASRVAPKRHHAASYGQVAHSAVGAPTRFPRRELRLPRVGTRVWDDAHHTTFPRFGVPRFVRLGPPARSAGAVSLAPTAWPTTRCRPRPPPPSPPWRPSGMHSQSSRWPQWVPRRRPPRLGLESVCGPPRAAAQWDAGTARHRRARAPRGSARRSSARVMPCATERALPTPDLTPHHHIAATNTLNISVTPSFLSSGVVTVRHRPSARARALRRLRCDAPCACS